MGCLLKGAMSGLYYYFNAGTKPSLRVEMTLFERGLLMPPGLYHAAPSGLGIHRDSVSGYETGFSFARAGLSSCALSPVEMRTSVHYPFGRCSQLLAPERLPW